MTSSFCSLSFSKICGVIPGFGEGSFSLAQADLNVESDLRKRTEVREREREQRAGGLFSQYFRSHEDNKPTQKEKKLLKTYVHPKTRNNATTSARRAVGSLDVLRSYRNPCFKHVSWTSLYRFQRSEIREKKSVTLEIQNCFKKKREKTCSEEEEKLKNARQRDRFGGRFIPAFREIQDHLYIVTCLRAKRGRTKSFIK